MTTPPEKDWEYYADNPIERRLIELINEVNDCVHIVIDFLALYPDPAAFEIQKAEGTDYTVQQHVDWRLNRAVTAMQEICILERKYPIIALSIATEARRLIRELLGLMEHPAYGTERQFLEERLQELVPAENN